MSRRDFFQLFCMFYLQCITRKCAKEKKNFDIQRNTRVASGGQITSNRLSNDHISSGGACSKKRLEGLLGVPEGDNSALLSL